MWWWVLTSPGVTRQPDASSVSAAAGRGSADAPTPEISPFVIATHPPGSSRREPSQVATSLALTTSKPAPDISSGTGVERVRVLQHAVSHALSGGQPFAAPLEFGPVSAAPGSRPVGNVSYRTLVSGIRAGGPGWSGP